LTINEIKVFGYLQNITKISGRDVTAPKGFEIYQNYPNPFNAQTTIPYALSELGYVKLAVYNMQGQLVRELVDENLDPGRHSVRWDGRDEYAQYVSSGIYIYRMDFRTVSGEKRVNTKKMIFIK